jgi:hypothetical protein
MASKARRQGQDLMYLLRRCIRWCVPNLLPKLFALADSGWGAVEDMYESSGKACFTSGSGVGWMDPQSLVAGMASVSKSVAFGITGSTSYINVSSLPHCAAIGILTMAAVYHVANSSYSRPHHKRSIRLECCDELLQNRGQGNGKERGGGT